jgi:hypothetical protein
MDAPPAPSGDGAAEAPRPPVAAATPPPLSPAAAPPAAPAAPHTPAPTSRWVDIRSYVPESGATGLRFSEAHGGASLAASPGSGPGADARAAPQAPLGLPPVLFSPQSASQRAARVARIRLETARCEKWRAMLSEWDGAAARGAAPAAALSAAVKRRCRKGVPDALRGAAWLRLLRADAGMRADPTLYADLLALPVCVGDGGGAARAGAPAPPPPAPAPSPGASASTLAALAARGGGASARVVDTIERDINRTFPQFGMFSEVGGRGQRALFRVLVAYAQLDEAVGYCQGMAFIAALFLSFAPETHAFFMFRAVLQRPPHRLADLYAPGLPRVALLEHTLQALVNARLPATAAVLHRHGLHPTMWAAQWLLTIFTYSWPFPVVVRIWDAFLCEGWKVVFRVSLAALKTVEHDLARAAAFEDVMAVFKALPARIDADALLADAFALRLASADLDALREEYEQVKAAGLDTATALAGAGLAAHAAAAARAAKK